MKNLLIIIVALSFFIGCTNEKDPIVEPMSVQSFSFSFSLQNTDQESAYSSYDEYLEDTTQAPHSPNISWANGESSAMKFQIYTCGSDSSVASARFIIRDNLGLIYGVVKSSPDSTARGLVHWNNNQIDTLSIHGQNPNGLWLPRHARLIIYNRDTIYNESERLLNDKYQHFYIYSTIPVILDPSG